MEYTKQKSSKRLQDAKDVNTNNVQTLDECVAKMKSNETELKAEYAKKVEIKALNDTLKDRFQNLTEERYRGQKELDRVRGENEAKQNTIDHLKSTYEAELTALRNVLNKKIDKLEKILKKKLEKETNIQEMERDHTNVER